MLESTSRAVTAWEDDVMAAAPTPACYLVASRLARFADADGGNAFPGVVRLAHVTRLTERTVIRALGWLKARGFIALVSRSNRWQGMADVYRLVFRSRPSRAARSHDTSTQAPGKTTTGRGSVVGRPDPVAAALANHATLTTRESRLLLLRANRLLFAGRSRDAVLGALTAPLPDDTTSVAALLHARLIEVERRSDPGALAWLASLSRRVRKVTVCRHTSTVPRTQADFGADSRWLPTW